MATGGWITDSYAMDLRVFPRESVEVNIAVISETLQLWHDYLGHQVNHHV